MLGLPAAKAPMAIFASRRAAAKIWVLPLTIACCTTPSRGSPSKSHDPLEAFARSCGVPGITQEKSRIFASPDESSWREYPSPKEIPTVRSEQTETASVWSREGSATLVRITGVRQDFADDSYYCFSPRGILIQMEREFRTARRWGFAEIILYDNKGNEEERTSRYFDTRNEQTIEPPKESGLVTP
jgi:hypothetical protein